MDPASIVVQNFSRQMRTFVFRRFRFASDASRFDKVPKENIQMKYDCKSDDANVVRTSPNPDHARNDVNRRLHRSTLR